MNSSLGKSMVMTKEEGQFFRQKIFEIAGISLSESKTDLIQSRLRTRVINLGFSSFTEYYEYLKSLPANSDEWEMFINQLTTNKTDWFREIEHFNFLLNEFLLSWKSLGKKHLNVWCAASSTGEEPYTLSMVLHKALKGTGTTYEVLATDIDTRVLEFASNGVYPTSGLDLVPEEYKSYAFALGTEDISQWMKVKKDIKNKVKFKQVNLSDPPQLKDAFDLIFCRNVLIYFNPQTIEKVIDHLFEAAQKEAVLVISHSESLQNINTKWKYVRPSIYYKGSYIS